MSSTSQCALGWAGPSVGWLRNAPLARLCYTLSACASQHHLSTICWHLPGEFLVDVVDVGLGPGGVLFVGGYVPK